MEGGAPAADESGTGQTARHQHEPYVWKYCSPFQFGQAWKTALKAL